MFWKERPFPSKGLAGHPPPIKKLQIEFSKEQYIEASIKVFQYIISRCSTVNGIIYHIIYHREMFQYIISRGSIVGGIILGWCPNRKKITLREEF